eukprot:1453669-Lingulodinium_polyedra.AAC.1
MRPGNNAHTVGIAKVLHHQKHLAADQTVQPCGCKPKCACVGGLLVVCWCNCAFEVVVVVVADGH